MAIEGRTRELPSLNEQRFSASRAQDRYRSRPQRRLGGQSTRRGDEEARRLANGLGWFSIGLGTAQLFAADAVCRLVGVDRDRMAVMRVLGARELAAGIGVLSQRRQGAWLQARVAGDVMDLALLGMALAASPNKGRVLGAMAAVAGVTVLDVYGARALGSTEGVRLPTRMLPAGREQPVSARLTVNRSIEDCYRFWRELTNLPRFMANIEEVRVLDEKRSRWSARAPAGTRVEWDAEITEERPNEFIAWRSLPGADVDNAGRVQFEPAPGGRGTVVRVRMAYRPPAGRVGALAAKLMGDDPEHLVREDLRRFKRVIETGEIPTTRGQPSGRRSMIGRAARLGDRYAR